MQQPTIGLLKTITAGFTERTVKPGSHISFTVQRKVGEQSWLVRMLGREVRVVSDLQLQVGARLKATVQFESGKLLLKIDQHSHALNTILQNSSLGDTPQNRALIQAFIAQGLPIREEGLQSALKLFSQLEVQDARSARLIAILQDKGLLLTADQFRRLQGQVFGDESPYERPQHQNQRGCDHGRQQNSGQQNSGQQNSGQQTGEHSGRQGGQQHSRPQDRENRLLKSVTGEVKEQVQRKDNGGSLLHLFNHKQAEHNNWIIIPISFRSEDTGILRLQLSQQGKPENFTITFNINTAESPATWHFSGRYLPKGSKLQVYRGRHAAGQPNREILLKLQQKLNNLRFEIDDTIREAYEFDPFGPEEGAEFKRVDTTA